MSIRNFFQKDKEFLAEHKYVELSILKQLTAIPNILTIARVLLLPFLMISLVELEKTGDKMTPIIIGSFMLLTDLLDGPAARKLNQVTRLGAFLDPVTDKLIIIGLGVVLVILGYIPAYIVGVQVVRDLLIIIFGYRIFCFHGKFIQTNIIARLTPLAWGITYILFVARLHTFAWVMSFVAILFTFISGMLYLRVYIIVQRKAKAEGIKPKKLLNKKHKNGK